MFDRTKFHRTFSCFSVLATSFLFIGCASYMTPGGGADMTVFTSPDHSINEAFKRQPESPIPANIAVARVQDNGYYSKTARSYGQGAYSVVTVRDVEKDEDFKRMADMNGIAGLVPLSRLTLSHDLKTDHDLRRAAATLHADMLLIYTFDTHFNVGDALPPLSVLTLGLSPNQFAKVTTTASALLVDVRTGFIYGAAETTADTQQIANAWTNDAAVDQSRQRTERKAFEKLVDEFVQLWPRVATQRRAALASGQ